MKTQLKKIAVCVAVIMTALGVLACAALTKKGTQCKRAPSPGSVYCWQHGGTTAAQRAAGITAEQGRCKAITNSGAQCSRPAQIGGKYCWQHVGKNTDHDSNENDRHSVDGNEDAYHQPTQISGQCTAITKKGTRCTRKAKSGSSRCWQHSQD
jgi:hypothetical protein